MVVNKNYSHFKNLNNAATFVLADMPKINYVRLHPHRS